MKVYEVIGGDGSTWGGVSSYGLFSTEEKAQKFIAKRYNESLYWDIKEREVR